jgi:hypothetical protein
LLGMDLVEVGFWAPLAEVEQPSGRPRARSCVDTTWDARERAVVAAYVRYAGCLESYELGYSTCRFGCGTGRAMGCAALTDGVFVWPEAYHHYITVHGVRPPATFVEHVRAAAAALASGGGGGGHGGADERATAGSLPTSASLQHDDGPLGYGEMHAPATQQSPLTDAWFDAGTSQAARVLADGAVGTPAPPAPPADAARGGAAACDTTAGDAVWCRSGGAAAVVRWQVRHGQQWDAAARYCAPLPAATRQYLRVISTLLL